MTRLLIVVLLSGCSLIAPIRDRSFGLADAAVETDAGDGADAASDAGTDAGPQCTETCMEPTPVCDAMNDRCVDCVRNEDCDDGDHCTADRCLDSQCESTVDTFCMRQVAVGTTHTCARRAGGTIMCWGSNAYGELGNDAAGMVFTDARRVLGIDNAIDITVGDGFSCAVREGGSVQCWGSDASGRLGSGDGDDSSGRPVSVLGIGDAAEIASGFAHTCARRRNGAVVCWGAGNSGQLGDGMTGVGHLHDSAFPISGGALMFAALSAEGAHTCALRANGRMACWGENAQGQLGRGTMTTAEPLAGDVLDITDAFQIAGHCAARGTGSIACWGDNLYGQIGDDTMARSARPVSLGMVITDAIDVASSYQTACALRRNGEVLCWGRNDQGQLGIGEVGGSRDTPTPVVVLTDAVGIAVGPSHACAVRRDGHVWCWGDNDANQVNSSPASDQPTPVEVTGLFL
jgi:alpha-tubulin suppressor-like RCC1 family protein